MVGGKIVHYTSPNGQPMTECECNGCHRKVHLLGTQNPAQMPDHTHNPTAGFVGVYNTPGNRSLGKALSGSNE